MIRHIDDLVAEDIPSMSTKELLVVRDLLLQKSEFKSVLLLVNHELLERREKGEDINNV